MSRANSALALCLIVFVEGHSSSIISLDWTLLDKIYHTYRQPNLSKRSIGFVPIP